MQVSYKPPVDRGVTQLMYVGDDEAVEKAVAAPSSKEMLVGAIAAIVALQSKGVTRLAAGGIAGYIGYRLYQSRK
jgi:hypothetical protein